MRRELHGARPRARGRERADAAADQQHAPPKPTSTGLSRSPSGSAPPGDHVARSSDVSVIVRPVPQVRNTRSPSSPAAGKSTANVTRPASDQLEPSVVACTSSRNAVAVTADHVELAVAGDHITLVADRRQRQRGRRPRDAVGGVIAEPAVAQRGVTGDVPQLAGEHGRREPGVRGRQGTNLRPHRTVGRGVDGRRRCVRRVVTIERDAATTEQANEGQPPRYSQVPILPAHAT